MADGDRFALLLRLGFILSILFSSCQNAFAFSILALARLAVARRSEQADHPPLAVDPPMIQSANERSQSTATSIDGQVKQ